MLMFLTILFTSIPVLILSYVIFAGVSPKNETAKTPPQGENPPKPAYDPLAAVTPARFFAAEGPPRIVEPRYPVEVLLSQIERHVRVETAAAETFLDVPTPESLHSRTVSPLLN